MTPNDLYTLFKTYGLNGPMLLIITSIAFIIYLIIKNNLVGKKINGLFQKLFSEPKLHINISNILNHNMFNYIDFWVYSRVSAMKFSSDYRTIIFRKYLTILLMKYKDHTNQYIASKVYEKMDDAELWKSILTLINSIVYDYEREMETMGIPKIIIEKMKEKNNETITLIIDLTESVCSSEFYNSENNLLKIYTIQNVLLSVLQNVINSSVVVCNSINGSLKGQFIVVDGKKIIEA